MLITESIRGIKYIYQFIYLSSIKSIYLSIYLQIVFIYSSNPSINPSIYYSSIHCPSMYPFIHIPIYPFLHIPIYSFIIHQFHIPTHSSISVYQFILTSIHPLSIPIHPHTHSSIYPPIHIPIHPSTHLFIHPLFQLFINSRLYFF